MGEFFTFAAIHLAMLCWAVALVADGGLARSAWTLALLFYLLHVGFAYDAFYGWSHRIAREETARQTAEVVGRSSGFGLWVNYIFGAILAADVIQQWRTGTRRYSRAIDGLVIFMIVNGAIIFADGVVRLYGAILIGAVIVYRLAGGRKAMKKDAISG